MSAARIASTLTIFAAMLVLVVVRPRRWSEAWWTMLGAASLVALGMVAPHDALSVALSGRSALLFLLSLLVLSMLVGKSGFFDWAAIRCARLANGDRAALYRNTFLLGVAVTATLSLDTTAVMLTPVVLALVKRLRLRAAPYVLLCALVANVASLALPISNLTNILFTSAFHFTFARYALNMLGPQVAALATTYAFLGWWFRGDLQGPFELVALERPSSVVPHRGYFRLCIAVLAVVLVGYFLCPLAGLEPYVVAFAGCGVLLVAGAATQRLQWSATREIAWDVFPFVVGLFVAVRGLENLGVGTIASSWLSRIPAGSVWAMLAEAGGAALASNVINNLPAALMARGILDASHASQLDALATLIGTDVGAIVTPFGSLATMLVIGIARREGHELRAAKVVTIGALLAPLAVATSTTTLWLVSRFLLGEP